MRYIVGVLILFIFTACVSNNSDKSSSANVQNADIGDTSALQPEVENRELQPPRPPAL